MGIKNLKSLRTNNSLNKNIQPQENINKQIQEEPESYMDLIGRDFDVTIIPGNTLLNSIAPENNWIIENLIPTGLTILSGDPKVGKSKLTRSLVLSILSGTPLWNSFNTIQGGVGYISNEENPNSVGNQISAMLENRNLDKSEVNSIMKNFLFIRPNSRLELGEGFDDFIEELSTEINQLKLVVIDPLAGNMSSGSCGYSYMKDYQALNRLQSLALNLDIAILAIHHNRKMESKKVFQLVSGTHGITGAAQAIMVLQRPDMSTNGLLHITGREIEQKIYKLKFNEQQEWEYVGEKLVPEQTPERQDIINVFLKYPGQSLKSSFIANELSKKQPTVSTTLRKMKQREGIVEDGDRYGEYKLTAYYFAKLKKEGN